MSGIFGFWNLDGRPADPALLAAMSGVLAHRGPDGWKGWCQGAVAIGHRMFRTTPESRHEVQPIVSRDGSRVLAADVRLDNRDELIGRFRLHDRPHGTLPDADIVLRVLDARGREAPQPLLGAFAYVAWDDDRRELYCARDHFGEKPLYYFHSPGRLFAFASEIKALLALDGVPDDIDDLEVARHLMIPVPEDPCATYYRTVRRVPPGHGLLVTEDGVVAQPYWTLENSRPLVLGSDAEYAEAVRTTFVEAVRCRMRSEGPVASMLSGGLDSSSVTSVAARLLADAGDVRPLRTLSAIYPTVPASDERRHIERVVERYGTAPTYFRADLADPVGDIHRLNWHGDGANKAGNLYVNDALYRAASASGARVVLDGYDGDSTLSHGDGWLVELAVARRWWTLLREVKARAEVLGEPWRAAVGAWIRAYGVAPALRHLPRRRASMRGARRETNGTAKWTAGLSAGFRRMLSDRVAPTIPAARTESEHHRRLMLRPILLQSLSWIEAIGAGAGVEVRVPFFDVRLVELCVSLPARQKLRRGWSRFVMRQAMSGILPEEIRTRPDKSNIEPGFYHALRSHAGERPGIGPAGVDDRVARYLDPAACAELHRRFAAGTVTPQERFQYWRMSSLALWLMGSDRAYVACGARGWEDSTTIALRGPTHQEV